MGKHATSLHESVSALITLSMQYTTTQVLEIVGISRRTLQVWIADGKVNKPGGQGAGRLWDIAEVKLLLELKQNSVRGRKSRQQKAGEGG
jgi:phage terminase Nu1 subunit (DNA packaging protein)